MKKSLWLVLVLGLAFAAQGCGFDPTAAQSNAPAFLIFFTQIIILFISIPRFI